MKIISLVENTTHSNLKAKHGLSLYIETKKHKVLFDLGSNHTLFENAMKKNIDLSQVDIVIISHGHRDHGGALKDFLNVNSSAQIYIQKKAFEAHYSKTLFIKIPVGLDQSLKEHQQIQLLDGDYQIDDELSLFTVSQVDQLRSPVNDVLYDENGKDTFAHEQNLIISENKKVLVMGCGHAGIVNILNQVQADQLDYCIGGFHLYNPLTRQSVSKDLLDRIAIELGKYENIQFYTCHCTGQRAYHYLSKRMKHMHYLSCGDELVIE